MKKLNLGKLKLVAEDVLQRNQLAGIYGGSGGNCDHDGNWSWWQCSCGSGPWWSIYSDAVDILCDAGKLCGAGENVTCR